MTQSTQATRHRLEVGLTYAKTAVRLIDYLVEHPADLHALPWPEPLAGQHPFLEPRHQPRETELRGDVIVADQPELGMACGLAASGLSPHDPSRAKARYAEILADAIDYRGNDL